MEDFRYTLGSSFVLVTDQLIAKRIAVSLNPLRMKKKLNCVQRFISYRALNTLRVGYENESANFVHRNIRSLF